MTETERKKAAKAFSEYWLNRGDEKSDSQSFWLSFIRDVLGVSEPEKYILYYRQYCNYCILCFTIIFIEIISIFTSYASYL